jgi:beta propeller repeat protein
LKFVVGLSIVALSVSLIGLPGCRLVTEIDETEREQAGDEIRITSAVAPQLAPDVSGPLIVWEDWRHGNAEIYLYDLRSEEERRLTDRLTDQTAPRISGNWVVWEDDRHGERDIYAYDLNSDAEQLLTPEGSDQLQPSVHDGTVVWRDNRDGNWELYGSDLSSGTVERLTGSDAAELHPALSSEMLVWIAGSRIRGRILSTGEEVEVPGDYRVEALMGLGLDGHRVVWTDTRIHSDRDIYVYDFEDRSEQLITRGFEQNHSADISGDRIVWVDDRGGAQKVFLFELGAGDEIQISPFDGIADGRPRIDGRRIVWTDRRAGGEDVYLFVLKDS